jgi:hypothetical protein
VIFSKGSAGFKLARPNWNPDPGVFWSDMSFS